MCLNKMWVLCTAIVLAYTCFCIRMYCMLWIWWLILVLEQSFSLETHRSLFVTCLKALITLFINHSCLLFIASKITKNLFIFERISDSWQVIKMNCVPSFPNCIVLLMTALFGALYHLVTWICLAEFSKASFYPARHCIITIIIHNSVLLERWSLFGTGSQHVCASKIHMTIAQWIQCLPVK